MKQLEINDFNYLYNNYKNMNASNTDLLQLNKYKVKNAIILAAGMSSRFAPLSYEKPKGLAIVKGEVLIERLIKQLKEAGVEEIVVVLGHMLEKFVYLKSKYNVKLVINNDYKTKNTHSSLFAARDFLGNSYICCADNYYPKNPFQAYEYRSFTSTLYVEGIEEGERGIFVDKNGLVIDTQRPAKNQQIMLGFQYFDKEFCKTFIPILEDHYHNDEFSSLYWEQIYAKYVDKLKLYTKKYKWEDILEFDTVNELKKYDKQYLSYGNYEFVNNICKTLKCKSEDIDNLTVINNGLTNKSFSFTVNNLKYIYRIPGLDAPEEIDRKIEKRNQEFAKEIGIDDSYIFENAEEGWKISQFIDIDETFDFNNTEHIILLSNHLKRLYSTGYKCGKQFSYMNKIENILQRVKEKSINVYTDISSIFHDIKKINESLDEDKWPSQLIHNDIWEDNLLIRNNKLYLIDWEYAGDADIGFDISKICVRSGCDISLIGEKLKYFFGRLPSNEEISHIIGCVVVSYYYWYVWATYMKLAGHDYESWIERYKTILQKYYNAYEKKGIERKWKL